MKFNFATCIIVNRKYIKKRMFCHMVHRMYKVKNKAMEMAKVQCIYIERLDGEKNVIETERQMIGGIRVGIIRQVTNKKTKHNNQEKEQMQNNDNRKIDKQDKNLLKVIKKLCDKETIIVANERIVQDFKIPNVLFEMKKKELLENITRIIEYLRGQIGKEGRRTFLLTIQSERWNQNEIEELLSIVKNRYENIYIHNQTDNLDTEGLAKYFYEEYGIVLHFIDNLQIRKLKIDTALFLVKYWKEECAMTSCCNGYVVAEFDHHQRTRRKRLRETKIAEENKAEKKTEIYMGFVYSYCGKQIPYELAVVMRNHAYLQHLLNLNRTKNEISIVAIYGVEWYN